MLTDSDEALLWQLRGEVADRIVEGVEVVDHPAHTEPVPFKQQAQCGGVAERDAIEQHERAAFCF